MKTILLIGAGNRGATYVKQAMEIAGEFKVVGVAEPDDNRRNYIKKNYDVDFIVVANNDIVFLNIHFS